MATLCLQMDALAEVKKHTHFFDLLVTPDPLRFTLCFNCVFQTSMSAPQGLITAPCLIPATTSREGTAACPSSVRQTTAECLTRESGQG